MALRRYTPIDLLSEHNQLRESITAAEFFGPRYQKERERFCAGHFSLAYAAAIAPCEVEIEDPDPQNHVDFWLVTPTGRHAFQVTERQEPERRRGHEYKIGLVLQPTEEALELAATLGADWIVESVLKKDRSYGGGNASLHLLVYVNFPTYDLRFEDIQLRLQTVQETFGSIWLLAGDSMACAKSSPKLGQLNGWFPTPARASEA
jgi:hypothetical protein